MISLSLIATITSPTLSHASHAGKSVSTSFTKIPVSLVSFFSAFSDELISTYCIPMIGLDILPKVSIDLIVHAMNSWLKGNAKVIPSHSSIAVVIPIVLPSISSKGPQLFPGPACASV